MKTIPNSSLHNLKRRILLFLLFFLITPIHGENIIFDLADKKDYPLILTSHATVLEDSSLDLKIEDILSPKHNSEFKLRNISGNAYNFSYTDSAIWIKLSIRNSEPITKDYFLEIQYPRLMNIFLYLPEGNSYKKVNSGYSVPQDERPYKSRYFTFPIRLDANKTSSIYLRITSPNAIVLPFFLWDTTSYHNHDVEDHIIQSLYFGILFSMIAYNLLIYIFLRDKSYLYYVLFVISSGVGIAAFNGIAGEWLWGDNPYIEKIGVNAWSVIACTTLMFFMRRMLNSKIDTPILDKFNWLTMFIQWTALFLMLWDFKGFVKLVIFSQIFIAGWITFYSIIRSFQKNRASYFFVTAFTFLMIAISSGYLRVLGILPINKFTTEGVQISSAIQMILLAIALADRYNTLRKEKERAEALIQENLKKSNLELEEKVKERTHELNKSLHLIKEDLNLAKKIQMNALSMNPTDIKDLKLAIKYLPMTEVGGDFFDISKIDDRTYRIFIADATGHGVQAAMITMVIKGIYDNIKSFGLKPNEILEIFNNEFIHKYISLNSYLTAIVVDIDTESKTLTYVSAGHPSSILLSRGEIKELTRTGKIIGVFKGTNYQSITINFSEKDKLFLFTDGIFEEFNKSEEEFGEERLQEIIRKNHDKSISEIIDISLDELNSFLGAKEKQDDITIIGIELN